MCLAEAASKPLHPPRCHPHPCRHCLATACHMSHDHLTLQLRIISLPPGKQANLSCAQCRMGSGRMWGRTAATGARSPLLGSTPTRFSRWRACPCPCPGSRVTQVALQMSRRAPPAESPIPAWTVVASQGSRLLPCVLGDFSLDCGQTHSVCRQAQSEQAESVDMLKTHCTLQPGVKSSDQACMTHKESDCKFTVCSASCACPKRMWHVQR